FVWKVDDNFAGCRVILRRLHEDSCYQDHVLEWYCSGIAVSNSAIRAVLSAGRTGWAGCEFVGAARICCALARLMAVVVASPCPRNKSVDKRRRGRGGRSSSDVSSAAGSVLSSSAETVLPSFFVFGILWCLALLLRERGAAVTRT
ncbi:unnamed protein product, partial [Ectocarpus sp. 8 AP-2014]